MSGWKNRSWQLKPLPGENPESYHARLNTKYFQEQLGENQEYWARLGEDPKFSGKSVLEVGCGHGALSIDIALKGAAEVVGLDLDQERIIFARQNLEAQYPALKNKVTFLNQDITEVSWTSYFDYIVSKDAIEHIDDLKTVFSAFAKILKPGGVLILGFSPLYYSPYGDHTRLALPLPWIHAFLPERFVLKWASKRLEKTITSISELGMNKLTPRQFRSLLATPHWQTIFINYNRGRNFLMPLFRLLRRIPFLEKYFTISIYTVVMRTTPN